MPTPQDIQTWYSRVNSVSMRLADVDPVRLISGNAGIDYKGTPTFPANTLGAGDVIRVFSWGRLRFSEGSGGALIWTILFGPGNPVPLNQRRFIVATTGVSYLINSPLGNELCEWQMIAEIKVLRAGGGNPPAGLIACDGTVYTPVGSSALRRIPVGAGAFFGSREQVTEGNVTFDTTVDNTIEIAVRDQALPLVMVRTGFQFVMTQATIEYLKAPQ